MRGAPNPAVAQAFVEFVLSDRGQMLWNAEPGSPMGPTSKALRRMPVRRDLYTEQNMEQWTDGLLNPYEATGTFVYRPELTNKAFGTIRSLVRIIGIDSHEEMKRAWKEIREAGFPPEATAVFFDVSILKYESMKTGDQGLSARDPLDAARRASELGAHFRRQYLHAEKLALEAKRKGGSQ
jgi:hypothetical protein